MSRVMPGRSLIGDCAAVGHALDQNMTIKVRFNCAMSATSRLRSATTRSTLETALRVQGALCPQYALRRIDTIDAPWRSAKAFFADDSAIEELLAAQQDAVPGLDRKGQAAFAIGAYAYVLAAGIVPLFVGFRVVPRLSPSCVAVALARGGGSGNPLLRFALIDPKVTTDAPVTNAARRDLGDDALCELFGSGLEEHMQPLIAKLHERTGLSRGALWRLVADYVAQLFLDAGERFEMRARSQADALGVLKRPRSPLSNRQLHFFDLAVDEHEPAPCRAERFRTFVSRGGCCRQYTVDGYELCPNCVLQKPEARILEVRKQFTRPDFAHGLTEV